ncbi:1,2-phenylacetyl-CoA epoxidase subunit PaaD [Arthrobacter sp. LAPM80]|uniref:1,2-phenylacetyl-CoA epoxidase subunit PaaD n=1 Tax=Arthrobacter sp. LAPM80 TaxID=3141788 RepID=UPI00398AE93E
MAETRTPVAETKKAQEQAAWEIAAAVCDPELPVLTIADLGILRSVGREQGPDGPTVRVVITPTYSGCPAMDVIRSDLHAAFERAGLADVEVVTVLSPAWTTDWISEEGRAKLAEFGIAPPSGTSQAGGHSGPLRLALHVKCPHCQSLNTHERSRFGSTSCKALYTCRDCKEPFDYFKVF